MVAMVVAPILDHPGYYATPDGEIQSAWRSDAAYRDIPIINARSDIGTGFQPNETGETK